MTQNKSISLACWTICMVLALQPALVFASAENHKNTSECSTEMSVSLEEGSEVPAGKKRHPLLDPDQVAGNPYIDPGYSLLPWKPLFRTLRDPDKRWYVLLEQPLMGLITTPAASMMANWLSGGAVIPDNFVRQAGEIYLSYNGTNVIRNGVGVDESITPRSRIVLNWWYSSIVYAFFTAGDKIATAVTPEQKIYAGALVSWAFVWPILSQTAGVKVWIPLLFKYFPSGSLLNEIHDPRIPTEVLVQKYSDKVKEKEAALQVTSSDSEQRARSESQVKVARAQLFWVKRLREGQESHRLQTLEKLEKETQELVALEAEIAQIESLQEASQEGESQVDSSHQLKEKRSQAKKLRSRVKKLLTQGISGAKKAAFWAFKTAVGSAVAVLMVTIYFQLRWLWAGHHKEDDTIMKQMFRSIMAEIDPSYSPTQSELDALPETVRKIHSEIAPVESGK